MLQAPMLRNAFGGVNREASQGDLIATFDQPTNLVANADAAQTWTAANMLTSRFVGITGTLGAGRAVTLPTADQLVKFVRGPSGLKTPPDNALYGPTQALNLQWPNLLDILPPGITLQWTCANVGTGQTITLTAPASSGVSIDGAATIATNKVRSYLLRFVNSAPSVTLICSTSLVAASLKKLSNVDLNLINQIVPGMAVYGTGIGASAVVSAVDRDRGIIYVTVDSTATADNIAVSFTPVYTLQNLGAWDV